MTGWSAKIQFTLLTTLCKNKYIHRTDTIGIMRLFFTRYQIYRDEVSVDMEYAHANGSPERTSSKAVSARWPTIPQSVLGGAV